MSHRIGTPRDTINSITFWQVLRSLCVVGLLLLSTTSGFLVGCRSSVKEGKVAKARNQASTDTKVKPTAFLEKNNGEEHNASGVVPLGDSRFLFCDNNLNDALMELVVSKDGQQQGPLVRRPLVGLGKQHIDDMEELTIVEQDGRRLVFAVTSLSVKPGSKKKGKEEAVRPGGLLRITIQPDGFLATELMSDFRAWLVVNAPEIASSAENDPEVGGLNIEGLAWDARRGALLLGIRTPVPGGKPLIRPVRIKDLAGPWTTDNLEMLPPIHLAVENAIGEEGIRSITGNGFGEGFFVVVGNSTSESEAPFSVYTWDGGDEGKVSRLPISFAKKMKPEGITTGTVGGRKALVFVDDGREACAFTSVSFFSTPKRVASISPGLPYSATLSDGAAQTASCSFVATLKGLRPASGAVTYHPTFRCSSRRPRETQPPWGWTIALQRPRVAEYGNRGL